MIARPVPASACCLAYATALAAACFAAPYAERAPWLPGDLWKGLALDVLGTAVVFRFSRRYSNSSVYDPFWVLAPLALGFYWKAKAPGGFWYYEPRETMCLVLLWAWATRFLVGVPWDGWTRGLAHEDWRYEQIRTQRMPSEAAYWAFSLASLHVTPTLLVFAALCPVGRVLLQGTAAPPLGLVDALGAGVAAAALVVEAVADEQLRRFRQRESGRPPTSMREGLWRWSRHPNYFGECLFWTGLLGLAVGAGAVGPEPALCGGALGMWVFFRAASVPLMDQRSLERRPDYAEVMRTTSALVPWPPRAPRRSD